MLDQRERLRKFVTEGNPALSERCISPRGKPLPGEEGKKGEMFFLFDRSGDEVRGMGRKGIEEWVMRVKMSKGVGEVGLKISGLVKREDMAAADSLKEKL